MTSTRGEIDTRGVINLESQDTPIVRCQESQDMLLLRLKSDLCHKGTK